MIDHERPPVVIEDRPDADPLVWLTWIVDRHPHVTEEGQVVLIDGDLAIRLLGDRPAPVYATPTWSLWVTVQCAKKTADDPDPSRTLVAITPLGRGPFEAPVPARQRLADSRLMLLGPSLRQLVEELAA